MDLGYVWYDNELECQFGSKKNACGHILKLAVLAGSTKTLQTLNDRGDKNEIGILNHLQAQKQIDKQIGEHGACVLQTDVTSSVFANLPIES